MFPGIPFIINVFNAQGMLEIVDDLWIQVFRLAHNKWAIATQKQFTTHQVCGKNRKPDQAPLLPLNLDARSDYIPTFWQPTLSRKRSLKLPIFLGPGIFPDFKSQQFSKAMQSLNDNGPHIVDAADIAHHLKFENFNEPIPTSITDLFTNRMHSIYHLYSLELLFCFYVTNFINCIVRKFMTNSKQPFPH